MDYENKYKKALEKAREQYNKRTPLYDIEYVLSEPEKSEDKCWQNWLIELFPELKENESEDERIRKAIIAYISYDQHCGVSNKDMIAWLKKQKVTDEEIIFRPIAGTDIRIAAKQALEKIDIGKKVVLAFNGAYIPVNGKTVGEIDSEYDAWLEKQEMKDNAISVLPSLGNNQVQDILEDMGMLDNNGQCLHTAEEIFKAGMEYLYNLNHKAFLSVILDTDMLTKVLIKHLYTCVNKTNTYVRSEEDHITLSELIGKIKADLNIK